jgi:hypothetical protein
VSGKTLRAVSALFVAGLLASGCSTQARWVNCEGRLEPINQPAPKAVVEPTPAEPQAADQATP